MNKGMENERKNPSTSWRTRKNYLKGRGTKSGNGNFMCSEPAKYGSQTAVFFRLHES